VVAVVHRAAYLSPRTAAPTPTAGPTPKPPNPQPTNPQPPTPNHPPQPRSLRSILLNSWLTSAAGIQPPDSLEVITAAHMPRAMQLLQEGQPGRALWDLQVGCNGWLLWFSGGCLVGGWGQLVRNKELLSRRDTLAHITTTPITTKPKPNHTTPAQGGGQRLLHQAPARAALRPGQGPHPAGEGRGVPDRRTVR